MSEQWIHREGKYVICVTRRWWRFVLYKPVTMVCATGNLKTGQFSAPHKVVAPNNGRTCITTERTLRKNFETIPKPIMGFSIGGPAVKGSEPKTGWVSVPMPKEK